jgi:hypothetical protein
MNKLIIDNSIEPKRAEKKLSISNPGTTCATSKNSSALIININKPSVKIVIGIVIITKNGRIKTFTKPITKAAKKAALKLSMVMLGISHEINTKARAKSIHLITNNIFTSLIMNKYTI